MNRPPLVRSVVILMIVLLNSRATTNEQVLLYKGEEYARYASSVDDLGARLPLALRVDSVTYSLPGMDRKWPMLAFMWTPITSIFAVHRVRNSHLLRDSSTTATAHLLAIEKDCQRSGLFHDRPAEEVRDLALSVDIATHRVLRAHTCGLGFAAFVTSVVPLLAAPMETGKVTVVVRYRVKDPKTDKVLFEQQYQERLRKTVWLLGSTNSGYIGADSHIDLISRANSRFLKDFQNEWSTKQ